MRDQIEQAIAVVVKHLSEPRKISDIVKLTRSLEHLTGALANLDRVNPWDPAIDEEPSPERVERAQFKSGQWLRYTVTGSKVQFEMVLVHNAHVKTLSGEDLIVRLEDLEPWEDDKPGEKK